MTNLESVHWLKDAKCKGKPMNWFSSYDPKANMTAKTICMGCPVQRECLAYYHDIDCVSAGMSRYDRLSLLWKRVENANESNWKSPEDVFPRLFEKTKENIFVVKF